ncbi:MAG: NAD(P)-dependent oxidoreductase [Peptoniphilaceae bacterium]|nr:NAD(P)-dependent oxidoreductase [Peptoniphilaceae bacterium]
MRQDVIWISGASGRLGQALTRQLDPLEAEIIATDKNEVDITDINQVNRFVDRNRPKVIINSSGLSNREKCEENPDAAYLLNTIGAKHIAIASSRVKAKLFQLSTADVFDGNTIHPYKEIDSPKPNTVYGKSKYLGEQMVRYFAHRYFILRVSRLYSKENSFVEEIIRQAKETGKVEIARGQFFSPTPAYELAQFIIRLMISSNYGLYHASSEGYCSMEEFVHKILKYANLKAQIVYSKNREAVSLRPFFRAIDNYALNLIKTYEFADWDQALKKYMEMEGLSEI